MTSAPRSAGAFSGAAHNGLPRSIRHTTEVTDAASVWQRPGPDADGADLAQGHGVDPGGALVAGTAPDTLPRIADEEMSGEQVILKDFTSTSIRTRTKKAPFR